MPFLFLMFLSIPSRTIEQDADCLPVELACLPTFSERIQRLCLKFTLVVTLTDKGELELLQPQIKRFQPLDNEKLFACQPIQDALKQSEKIWVWLRWEYGRWRSGRLLFNGQEWTIIIKKQTRNPD